VPTKLPQARWWTFRRAQNRKPATYVCPFCGRHLPALSEHMLIAPEGDTRRRRHAHSKCVLAARQAGRLPTRDEWLKTQPREPGLWRRAVGRLRRTRRPTA
jgi:ribosomal protein L24E